MAEKILVLLALTVLAGCSSPMARGIRTYHAGAAPRALSYLMEAEHDAIEASPRTRARYALYRGLTHLSLGDDLSARRYLSEAKAWVDRDRSLLDASDRGRLLAAWRSMGYEPGTWGASVLHDF